MIEEVHQQTEKRLIRHDAPDIGIVQDMMQISLLHFSRHSEYELIRHHSVSGQPHQVEKQVPARLAQDRVRSNRRSGGRNGSIKSHRPTADV